MLATIASILAQAEEHGEEVSEARDLYPAPGELIVGLIAFAILFFFTWKWVLPRFRQILEDRRAEIQGQMEKAEAERKEASELQEGYRQQLAGARDEANRIIEEARSTAEQLRRDVHARAEQEAQTIVARAYDEIGAQRDRAFEELRGQVGVIAVDLAGRVVGESLDKSAHDRLIDEFIDQVAAGDGSANGEKGDAGGDGS